MSWKILKRTREREKRRLLGVSLTRGLAVLYFVSVGTCCRPRLVLCVPPRNILMPSILKRESRKMTFLFLFRVACYCSHNMLSSYWILERLNSKTLCLPCRRGSRKNCPRCGRRRRDSERQPPPPPPIELPHNLKTGRTRERLRFPHCRRPGRPPSRLFLSSSLASRQPRRRRCPSPRLRVPRALPR